MFRDRLDLPIPDAELDDGDPPYYHPGTDSPEYEYLMARRRRARRSAARARRARARRSRSRRPAMRSPTSSPAPATRCRRRTTTAFARLLRNLLRDPGLGQRVVPIIPDEARTFGLDALFREVKIYAPFGQPYEPVDADLLLSYQEATRRAHPRRGHHRGGLDGVVHRRRHVRTRRGVSR